MTLTGQHPNLGPEPFTNARRPYLWLMQVLGNGRPTGREPGETVRILKQGLEVLRKFLPGWKHVEMLPDMCETAQIRVRVHYHRGAGPKAVEQQRMRLPPVAQRQHDRDGRRSGFRNDVFDFKLLGWLGIGDENRDALRKSDPIEGLAD